jgi:urate oxidase
MLRIVRRGDRHDPRDLTIAVRFEGAFEAAFTEGSGAGVVPGEAIKNLVHRAARQHGAREIEELGLTIAAQLLERHPRISRVRIDVAESPWLRLEAGGRAQAQTFLAGSDEQRQAYITSNGPHTSVAAGLSGLTLLRSAGFAPKNARHDAETPEGVQPILIGTLSARWTYTRGDVTFGVYRQGVRNAVLETFAWHDSQSVQHALHAVAAVILTTYEEVADVTLAFHEKPYRPADLFAAGTENFDELFVAVEEPLGIVEVTVERGG